MNCTCPSGDGSLHHPCPSHPTSANVQPSPGGQGDALKALDDLAAFCSDDTATVDRHVAVIRAALAARQPVGEPEIEFQARLMDVKTNLPTENWRHSPIYEENPGRGTHYWVEYRKRYIYYAPPAQAVDLGQFLPLARWVVNCAGHGINDTQRRMGQRLLDLINSMK